VDITSITLYIKNIFVDPVIYDVLTLRKTLTLMRSRRLQVKQLTTPAGEVQLRQIKYPVESLVIGFRPNINADPTNVSSPTRWTQFSIKTRAELPFPTIINNPIVAPAQQLVVRTASYDQSTPVITALSLEAHGNILYPVLPEGFYDQYTAAYFPEYVATTEIGIYSIHFNQYYKHYNPSGHYDSSRARELVLKYSGGNISSSQPTTIYCEAMVINFVWASGDTMVLRYLT